MGDPLKRLFDFTSAFLLTALLLPIGVIVAAAVFVLDGWPILFCQWRVGRGLKLFRLYKFRTMRLNSEQQGFQTTEHDPRITRLGGFLRRSSLDELPQLLNILLGHMSLVGPRPDVPSARDSLPYRSEDWIKRHRVRPGLTGLAQVSGRSSLTFEKRLAYDLDYVDRHDMGTDFSILARTARVILRKAGTN